MGEFGVYADDFTAICLWLKESGVTLVAMESTGSYWQNLYLELARYGFDLVLCNGKFTKQAKGKKTDLKDCRWIQNQQDYLFGLKQELESYRFYQRKIDACDKQITIFLKTQINYLFLDQNER